METGKKKTKMLMYWIIFIILEVTNGEEHDQFGETWIIKSNGQNEPTTYKSPTNDNSPAFGRSKLDDSSDLYLIKTRTLDRPTRQPKEEPKSKGFEAALSESTGKSTLAGLKSKIQNDKPSNGNNYLLRVDDLPESKDGSISQRSFVSNVTRDQRSNSVNGTALNPSDLTRTHKNKQRQDIEQSPESYAGQEIGKPYGDPDGYQTIGDGIYLMSAEQESAITAGANTQNLDNPLKPDIPGIGDLASDRKSEHTSEPNIADEEPSLQQEEEAAKTRPQQASVHGEKLLGSQRVNHESQKDSPTESVKTGSTKELPEPTEKNIDQILTKLDPNEQLTSLPVNNTAVSNSSTSGKESGNAAPETFKDNADDAVSDATQAPVSSKTEPPVDIEDVTPKEKQVLQTFQDTLKQEDKQISKVMLAKQVDRSREVYEAKTKAMLQNENKQQLDNVFNKMKTEESTFIKKNPFVADKEKLLDAISNIKYRYDSGIKRKRGFLSRNDNAPVQNIYNSLLKEDEWLKNGLNTDQKHSDDNDNHNEDSEDTKVNQVLKFADSEDKNLAGMPSVASHSKESDTAESSSASDASLSTDKDSAVSFSKTPDSAASSSKSPASRGTALNSKTLRRKLKKVKSSLKDAQILVVEQPESPSSTSTSQNIGPSTKYSRKNGKKTGRKSNKLDKATLVLEGELSDNQVKSSGQRKSYQAKTQNNDKDSEQTSRAQSRDETTKKETEQSLLPSQKDVQLDASQKQQQKNQQQLRSQQQQKQLTANRSNWLKKYKTRQRHKSFKRKGKNGNENQTMKEGELTSEKITNHKAARKQKSKQTEDKEYYWHGTQKPETRQLPTDPAEQLKKFGRISNMIVPTIHNDLSDGDSKFIGDKDNIASDGSEHKTHRDNADDGDISFLKEYDKGMKDVHTSLSPINKINENEISSTAFFSASKSSLGPQKSSVDKDTEDVTSSGVVKNALTQMESKDMQEVKGYMDKDDSKTLAFFDQKSLQPKIEEFDDPEAAHRKPNRHHKTKAAAKRRKPVKLVLNLPELGDGETQEIHGKDTDDTIGSIQDISQSFTQEKKKRKPDLGQQIAQDDEATLESILSKPTAKLIEFQKPTTGPGSDDESEDSVGHETSDWSKDSENKETVPLTGSSQDDSKNDLQAEAAFTGSNILNLIKENEKYLPENIGNSDGDSSDSSIEDKLPGVDGESSDQLNKLFINAKPHKSPRKKQKTVGGKKRQHGNKTKVKIFELAPHGNSQEGSQMEKSEDAPPSPNIYQDQINYDQKQREVSEMMPTEAVSQIKAILNSDDNTMPMRFLEKDRQMFDSAVNKPEDEQVTVSKLENQQDPMSKSERQQEQHNPEAFDSEPEIQKEAGKPKIAFFEPKNGAKKPVDRHSKQVSNTGMKQDIKQDAKLDSKLESKQEKPDLKQESNQEKQESKPEKQDSKQEKQDSKQESKQDSKVFTKDEAKLKKASNSQFNEDFEKELNSGPKQSSFKDTTLFSSLIPSARKIKIQGGQIHGGNIKGGLITGGFVNGGYIEGGAISGGKVEGGHFRNGRMENGVLYNGTVEGGVVKGGEIYGGTMVSGLMDGGKLKGGRVDGGRLSGGEIDGGSLMSGEVQGGFLKQGSVEGGILKGGSIEGGHLLGGVMLGGHLRGGIVKSGIIRGGIIEGGVVEGGVIDDGVVIKGGVARGLSGESPTTKATEPSTENKHQNGTKQSTTERQKKINERSENSDKYTDSDSGSPTSLFKINVDSSSPDEHSAESSTPVESNTPNQQPVDNSNEKAAGSRENHEISILGAPESWPIKNKDLKNSDDSKHKVAPVTYADTKQPPPKPVDAKQDNNRGGGKTATTNKLRELLNDLDQPKASLVHQNKYGERANQQLSQAGSAGVKNAAYGVSYPFIFNGPTAAPPGQERSYGTTTRTLQDPSQKPAKVKYHWALNSVKGGKIPGSPGQNMAVIGGVKIHNGIATLNDGIARGYLDAGDFQGECVSDPDVCKDGLTISMTNKISRESIESPSRMYLFDSGAGSEDSRGMALWVNRGRIEGAVASRKGTWCLREDIRPFADKWVDLSLTWKPSQGLYLYANCELLAVSGFGRGCDVCTRSACHQTDSNTHLMIARPNKGPHFKLTHFSSGDISIYEDFFTIDGVKEHCGTNNDYLRKVPSGPAPARLIPFVPIKSPWDNTVNVMKKHLTYKGDEFVSPIKSYDPSDEFEVWPTPSGLTDFHSATEKWETDKAFQASTRQNFKVDGGYSDWTAWTPCLGACGGTSMSVRYCNNPVPKAGGNDCSVTGPARRTRVCGSADCVDTTRKNNVVKLSPEQEISKRKEIMRSAANKIDQSRDIKLLQEELKELQQR